MGAEIKNLRKEGRGEPIPTEGSVGTPTGPRVPRHPIQARQKDLLEYRESEEVAKERTAIRLIICRAICKHKSSEARRALDEVVEAINDRAGFETQCTKRRRKRN